MVDDIQRGDLNAMILRLTRRCFESKITKPLCWSPHMLSMRLISPLSWNNGLVECKKQDNRFKLSRESLPKLSAEVNRREEFPHPALVKGFDQFRIKAVSYVYNVLGPSNYFRTNTKCNLYHLQKNIKLNWMDLHWIILWALSTSSTILDQRLRWSRYIEQDFMH